MSRRTIDNDLVLKSAIEQIPVRLKRANRRQKELAEKAGTSAAHLSQILNFEIKSPRITMMNNIEKALQDWGV